MAVYNEHSFIERLSASKEAKKELLEKFKSRSASDDPAILQRKKEREVILKARALRAEQKEKERQKRLAEEKEARLRKEAELEIQRLKEEEEAAALAHAHAIEENERIESQLRLEAEQKAKRDARYAARKSRGRRIPPKAS